MRLCSFGGCGDSCQMQRYNVQKPWKTRNCRAATAVKDGVGSTCSFFVLFWEASFVMNWLVQRATVYEFHWDKHRGPVPHPDKSWQQRCCFGTLDDLKNSSQQWGPLRPFWTQIFPNSWFFQSSISVSENTDWPWPMVYLPPELNDQSLVDKVQELRSLENSTKRWIYFPATPRFPMLEHNEVQVCNRMPYVPILD